MNDIQLIHSARKSELEPCNDPASANEWARFAFYVTFNLLNKMEGQRYQAISIDSEIKSDGSPATEFEKEIETFTVDTLGKFYSEAGFIGEELGEINPEKEIKVIIDPIDGTRSFLSAFDSYAMTLSIVSGEEDLFSLVCIPPTREIGYRIGNESSKVFQYPIFDIYELPLFKAENNTKPILNVHPAKDAVDIIDRLYDIWKKREIALVRSISGSPALNILESAKGNVIYVNGWSRGGTQPYDLMGGSHIITGANGFILDTEGNPINPSQHEGLFVSGTNKKELDWILEIIR